MPASAVPKSVDYMQARARHGYWVPDMSVQCFAGWHLKLSAGGYTHHSKLSTACTTAYRLHSFTRMYAVYAVYCMTALHITACQMWLICNGGECRAGRPFGPSGLCSHPPAALSAAAASVWSP